MSVNSLYGFNPYASQNTGMNDDFMFNATNPNAQNLQQQLAMQQALINQGGQLQGDTFQKEESSSLGTGLKCAAVGGVGAGAGAYFFGDKLGAEIYKDGKFSDNVLKAYQEDPKKIAKSKSLEEFARQKGAIIEGNGFTAENYEAIKKYVSTPEAERASLSKEITDLVPAEVKAAPDNYKVKLFDTENAINNIDAKAIDQKALKDAKTGNLAAQMEELSNLSKRKALLEGLADDAKPQQIEELITKNPTVFGIEKTTTEEIAKEAKTIAQRYGTKAGAVAEVTPLVTNSENTVKNLRTTLNGEVAAHWDDAAKAFKESAPEALKNATKNFKWQTAGKWGAIAAGVGLVLGCLFGGDKA